MIKKIEKIFKTIYHRLKVNIKYSIKVGKLYRRIGPKRDNGYSSEIMKYWAKYDYKVNTKWHQIYSHINGIKDVAYMPENIFYAHIEPKLNDRSVVMAYMDKNILDKLAIMKTPDTILRNMHSNYYDANYNYLNEEKAQSIIENLKEEYIIKPTIGSGGGRNVKRISAKDNQVILDNNEITYKELIKIYKRDFIIQKKIHQSKELNDIYPYSVNTLKIMTLRMGNEIFPISSVLRLGNKGNYIDNQSAGGISCGITDGRVNNYAIDKYFNKYNKHPYTNYSFDQIQPIKEYDQIINQLKETHRNIYYLDIISWDIAIDSQSTPILIEFNAANQEINFHQANNGAIMRNFIEKGIKFL